MDTCIRTLCAESLTPAPQPVPPTMDLALSASFGSVDRWRAAFTAMRQASGGGAGWRLLGLQPGAGRLVNRWAPEHTQAVADCVPLLALDMHTHVQQVDAGASADASVGTCLQHIDWGRVHARYQQAVDAASDGLGVTADAAAGARLLDVRRAGVFAQSEVLAAGAAWCDPAQIDLWADRVPAGAPVVVYCVHGHEVSRAAALRLRAAGADARFLIGGLAGWQAQGRPVVARSGG